jgi:hypothetical protein
MKEVLYQEEIKKPSDSTGTVRSSVEATDPSGGLSQTPINAISSQGGYRYHLFDSTQLDEDEFALFKRITQPLISERVNYGYELVCEFQFAGCFLTFHPSQIHPYIKHSVSHFLRYGPPPRATCIFCDRIFENHNDPLASWRRRMLHIVEHYRCGARAENMRPDFFIIEYLWKKRILSSEDYKWAIRHTERRDIDGLVDLGYITQEMRRKSEKDLEEKFDIDKEERQRRRAKRNSKEGK